jgi:hypothetical protein
VLAIEISRVAAAQTGLAQQMMSWHTAAVSMAASIIDTNPANYTLVQSNGCKLTNDYFTTNGSTAYTSCPPPSHAGLTLINGLILNNAPSLNGVPNKIFNKATSLNECVHLQGAACSNADVSGCTSSCATSYDAKDYEFYSVLFKNGGTNYVVTFAPTTGTGGTIKLGNGNSLSLTGSDLLRQLRNLGVSPYTYGTVTGTGSTGGSAISTAGLTYSILPTSVSGPYVPAGSVALIGFPDGF